MISSRLIGLVMAVHAVYRGLTFLHSGHIERHACILIVGMAEFLIFAMSKRKRSA